VDESDDFERFGHIRIIIIRRRSGYCKLYLDRFGGANI
jgi:hypothetical protein